MYLTLFIISVILLIVAMLGFGVKLLLDRNAKITIHGCSRPDDDSPVCGCGNEFCNNSKN